MRTLQFAVLTVALILLAACAGAQDQADGSSVDLDWPVVRYVVVLGAGDGTWRFDVTVEHNDEGWDHYADAWQVVDPEDLHIIAERILAHPHDNEQPFTRSLSGIRIPAGTTTVIVRARCTQHGLGTEVVHLDLSVASGEQFEVTTPVATP